MFRIFKKKEDDFNIYAPVAGKCIPLSDVRDEVFSAKMMGDGFAIIPSEDTFVAPANGVIETIFPTKHAIGMKADNGMEILIHIGLDTVNLQGEGFTAFVKEKEKVKKGQAMIKVDKAKLEEKGFDLTTMVVFTQGCDKEVVLPSFHKMVETGECLMS